MITEEQLKNLQEGFNKLMENQTKAFWKNVYKSDDIHVIFSQLTKDDLQTIKRNLGLPIKSDLKKDELLIQVKNFYFESLKDLLTFLSDFQMNLIQKLVNSDGKLPFESNFEREVGFLCSHGIAFPMKISDEKYVIMPKETRELIKEHNSTLIKRNTEIIQATLGLLYFYGVISINKLLTIIQSYFKNDDLSYQDIRIILTIFMDASGKITYYGDFLYLSGYKEKDIIAIIDERYKHRLDYYPISKLMAIQASVPSFIEQSPQLNSLVNYINHTFTIDNKVLTEFLDKLVKIIKMGKKIADFSQLIQDYFDLGSQFKLENFNAKVYELRNNTRLWTLKGYMPNEYRDNNPK